MNLMNKILIFLLVIMTNGAVSENLNDDKCDKLKYFLYGDEKGLIKKCIASMNEENTDAIVITGLYFIEHKKIKQGTRLIELAAQKGSSLALYWLGILNIKGELENPNLAKAIDYLGKVEGELKPSALTNMAVLYAEGKGVKYDMVQANKLFQLSAELLAAVDPEKTNSDKWLNYQWHVTQAELYSNVDKYHIVLDENEIVKILKKTYDESEE